MPIVQEHIYGNLLNQTGKMTTKKRKFFAKVLASVLFTLIGFLHYLQTFDGAHSQRDLLWGIGIAIVSCMAAFMYFSVAKKTELFSPAWFTALFTVVTLLLYGTIMSTSSIGVENRAWGKYIFWFGITIFSIHHISRHLGKPREKDSFFKRIRLTEDLEETSEVRP